MNLRALARGKPCMIRLPGCISGGENETTVLAHVRMSGLSGMGLKAADILASWACSACHEAVDVSCAPYNRRRTALLEGVMRTQAELIRLGVIEIPGEREPRQPKLAKIFRRSM